MAQLRDPARPLSVKELFEAGVHFGHQTRRWNPKMRPYLYGSRNGTHIIDLDQTVQLFRRASGYQRSVLYRDLLDPRRFVSVDYWESRAAWEEFRARFAAEFEALDARCEALTLRETELGRFEPVR